MNSTAFWKLIDASRRGKADDLDGQAEALAVRLSKLPVKELVSFQDHFNRFAALAYRADLWGAANLINGGCSDDGFDDFIGWVISRGEKVFRAALADPDSLARVAGEGNVEFADLSVAASRVYLQSTGADDFYDLLPRRPAAKLKGDLRCWSGLDGNGMDEAKCRRLYPRLFKQFCAPRR